MRISLTKVVITFRMAILPLAGLLGGCLTTSFKDIAGHESGSINASIGQPVANHAFLEMNKRNMSWAEKQLDKYSPTTQGKSFSSKTSYFGLNANIQADKTQLDRYRASQELATNSLEREDEIGDAYKDYKKNYIENSSAIESEKLKVETSKTNYYLSTFGASAKGYNLLILQAQKNIEYLQANIETIDDEIRQIENQIKPESEIAEIRDPSEKTKAIGNNEKLNNKLNEKRDQRAIHIDKHNSALSNFKAILTDNSPFKPAGEPSIKEINDPRLRYIKDGDDKIFISSGLEYQKGEGVDKKVYKSSELDFQAQSPNIDSEMIQKTNDKVENLKKTIDESVKTDFKKDDLAIFKIFENDMKPESTPIEKVRNEKAYRDYVNNLIERSKHSSLLSYGGFTAYRIPVNLAIQPHRLTEQPAKVTFKLSLYQDDINFLIPRLENGYQLLFNKIKEHIYNEISKLKDGDDIGSLSVDSQIAFESFSEFLQEYEKDFGEWASEDSDNLFRFKVRGTSFVIEKAKFSCIQAQISGKKTNKKIDKVEAKEGLKVFRKYNCLSDKNLKQLVASMGAYLKLSVMPSFLSELKINKTGEAKAVFNSEAVKSLVRQSVSILEVEPNETVEEIDDLKQLKKVADLALQGSGLTESVGLAFGIQYLKSKLNASAFRKRVTTVLGTAQDSIDGASFGWTFLPSPQSSSENGIDLAMEAKSLSTSATVKVPAWVNRFKVTQVKEWGHYKETNESTIYLNDNKSEESFTRFLSDIVGINDEDQLPESTYGLGFNNCELEEYRSHNAYFIGGNYEFMISGKDLSDVVAVSLGGRSTSNIFHHSSQLVTGEIKGLGEHSCGIKDRCELVILTSSKVCKLEGVVKKVIVSRSDNSAPNSNRRNDGSSESNTAVLLTKNTLTANQDYNLLIANIEKRFTPKSIYIGDKYFEVSDVNVTETHETTFVSKILKVSDIGKLGCENKSCLVKMILFDKDSGDDSVVLVGKIRLNM